MSQLSEKEASLDDLVELEAARRGIPLQKLWQSALLAILENSLRPRYLDILPPPNTYRALIVGALQAAERGNRISFPWLKTVILDTGEFATWLDEASETPAAANSRRPVRKRAPQKRVVEVVRKYLKGEKERGRSGNQKRMWEHLKEHLPNATHRQGVEAMRSLGGSKPRGRPRADSAKST